MEGEPLDHCNTLSGDIFAGGFFAGGFFAAFFAAGFLAGGAFLTEALPEEARAAFLLGWRHACVLPSSRRPRGLPIPEVSSAC